MINKVLKNPLFHQIFKFVIVGGIATIIDWLIYYVLTNYLKIDPLISNVLSFSISTIYNYLASVKWVFVVNENKNKKTLFLEFILFSLFGLLLTELLLFIGIKLFHQNKMLIKIIATGIVMVFNFITRKIFLEK